MDATSFDGPSELAALERLHAEIERLFALGESRLRLPAPAISAWAPLQHLAHLTLANELCVRNAQSLAKREGLLVQRGKSCDPQALDVLREGKLPRGRAQSPRIVVPPVDVELDFVRGWHRDNLEAIAALEASSHALVASECTIPHQMLGPLDLPAWLRFAAVHTRHHLAIASEALASHSGAAAP